MLRIEKPQRKSPTVTQPLTDPRKSPPVTSTPIPPPPSETPVPTLSATQVPLVSSVAAATALVHQPSDDEPPEVLSSLSFVLSLNKKKSFFLPFALSPLSLFYFWYMRINVEICVCPLFSLLSFLFLSFDFTCILPIYYYLITMTHLLLSNHYDPFTTIWSLWPIYYYLITMTHLLLSNRYDPFTTI